MRKASLIAATLLLSACGDENEPLRYFCAQIASESQLEACISDASIRRQLVESRAAEYANQRIEFAADYDLRELERGLTADVINDAQRVEIGELPEPLEQDDHKRPSPGSIYVVRGEIWVDSGDEEGERSYVSIGRIHKNAALDDIGWFAENQLLSPRQLETLGAICAVIGDSDHPICVGDIYVEIVPDAFFGREPAVRGAKLRRPTYEEYYRKELSSLEEWLARVEQPSA